MIDMNRRKMFYCIHLLYFLYMKTKINIFTASLVNINISLDYSKYNLTPNIRIRWGVK